MLTMRKIMFLLFFLAVFNVDGTQDANISFDSKGFDYCIAIDNLTYYTCYPNQSISIDGTKDHRYYIIPKPPITEPTGNTTQDRINEVSYTFLTILNFIQNNTMIFGLFFMAAVVVILAWSIH